MIKHIIAIKRLSLLPLLILAVFGISGCTDKLVDSSDTQTVAVKMEMNFAASELAEAVNLVCLTVSAPDMTPIVSCQVYDGSPITFELDVPAGRDRLFVLRGTSVSLDGVRIIYEGSTTVDIEPDETASVNIVVEPVVPLVRFSPTKTEVPSGASFEVDIEIFNMPALRETELRVDYDFFLLTADSVVLGSSASHANGEFTIDPAIEMPMQILVSDPDSAAGSIVDTNGYSHLATIYFTSDLAVESAISDLDIVPSSFATSDGSTIDMEDVFSQMGTVGIGRFTLPMIRLTPGTTEIQAGESFSIGVEGFNLSSLREASLSIAYESDLIQYNFATKGTTLGDEDVIDVTIGATNPALNILISDPNATTGSIVDANGHSFFATLYFTSSASYESVTTLLPLTAVELLRADGSSIPTEGVGTQQATIVIGSIPQPLLRFTPTPSIVPSFDPFQMDIEIFNCPDLSEINFGIDFDYSWLWIDSVGKGLTLDNTDTLIATTGDVQVQSIRVRDIVSGTIVDSDNYAHLATVYFSTLRIDSLVAATVAPAPDTFITSSSGYIPTTDVVLEEAVVSIEAFDNYEVFFDDNMLEYVVRNALEHYEGPILRSQVLTLTGLTAPYNEIAQLGGIEELVNLINLDLSNNMISDISPLAQLTALWTLNLGYNDISNLAPLSGLGNLGTLTLRENLITDISALGSLVNLTVLDISNGGESSGNAITDLTPLANMTQLGSLDVGWNYDLVDLSGLESLTSLYYLSLEWNSIVDITPLMDNYSNGGIGTEDYVNLYDNPYNGSPGGPFCADVYTLWSNGVEIYSDCAF